MSLISPLDLGYSCRKVTSKNPLFFFVWALVSFSTLQILTMKLRVKDSVHSLMMETSLGEVHHLCKPHCQSSVLMGPNGKRVNGSQDGIRILSSL